MLIGNIEMKGRVVGEKIICLDDEMDQQHSGTLGAALCL